jgi:hypothetical protein
MKKLLVTIKLEMEIPDDWELVEHPDEIQALKMDDGNYMYMSFLPMLTKQFVEGSEWSSECTDEFSDEVLNMVLEEDVIMKLEPN